MKTEAVHCEHPGCKEYVGERFPEIEDGKIYPPLCDEHFESVGLRIFANTVKTMTAAAQAL